MFARVVVVALAGIVFWAILARDSDAGHPTREYRVRPGDTLWSIALATHAGDPREGIWELRRRNRLAGVVLVPGQRLVLP